MSTGSVTAPARPRRTGYLAELWRRREFAWYMAMGNIQARHSATALGLLWWVLSPLMLGMVFYLVFGLILQTPRGDNIGWLLTGLFGFYFTRGVMSAGAQAIISNSVLVSTQRFPRVLLPIAAVIEEGAGFLASLIPLFVIAGLTGAGLPTTTALWLPVVIFFQVLFNLGITLLVALLIIPFRDINNLLPYATRIWLYLSPVIFDIGARLEGSSLPEVAQRIITANPMVAILGWYRHATIGDPLEPYHVWGTIAWSVALFVVGVVVFIRNEHRLVRYL